MFTGCLFFSQIPLRFITLFYDRAFTFPFRFSFFFFSFFSFVFFFSCFYLFAGLSIFFLFLFLSPQNFLFSSFSFSAWFNMFWPLFSFFNCLSFFLAFAQSRVSIYVCTSPLFLFLESIYLESFLCSSYVTSMSSRVLFVSFLVAFDVCPSLSLTIDYGLTSYRKLSSSWSPFQRILFLLLGCHICTICPIYFVLVSSRLFFIFAPLLLLLFWFTRQPSFGLSFFFFLHFPSITNIFRRPKAFTLSLNLPFSRTILIFAFRLHYAYEIFG